MTTPTPPPLPPQPAPQQKKRGCLRWFLIAIGAFFGLIIVLVIIGSLSKPPGSQPTSSVSSPTPEERPISWTEIDAIYNLKGNNTDLQKNEEWKRFKGRRVTWSGTVSGISDGWTGLTLQVKMNPDTFTYDLSVQLKQSEKAKAIRLHEDDKVRFSGRLKEWGSLMPITLDDGEILE